MCAHPSAPRRIFRGVFVVAASLSEERDEVVDAVRLAGANGVLVAASSLPSVQLNKVVRDLLVAGVHVHLSSGIRGIDVEARGGRRN